MTPIPPQRRRPASSATATETAAAAARKSTSATPATAERVVIVIGDDDDDDEVDDDGDENGGGLGVQALPPLHRRLPRSALLSQLQNTPSGSGAWQWHHFNRIDLTSPQFKAPPSHAQLLKPEKQKHNKIDLTSPNHLCKDRLKNKQKKDSTETTKVTLMCPICMERMREETSTSCGHIFCKSCITQSLLHQNKCPTCRKKISSNKIHRIYL